MFKSVTTFDKPHDIYYHGVFCGLKMFLKEENMNTITIKIDGQFVSKSSKNAVAAGSSNVCNLEFVFDESWRGFAKRVLWRDSKGENLTSIILTPEIENELVYKSTVPSSVTTSAG